MKKVAVVSVIVFVCLIAALTVLSFILDNEDQTLDYKTRTAIPGNFIKLSEGITYFRIDGPDKGEKIVLVHGLAMPSFVWENTFILLTRSGFRVIMYDLYGRGFSDRPDVAYDADLFDRQLVELLDNLKWKDRVNIAGLSMGGTVAVNFASRHPERVNKICLVAPFGFPQDVKFAVRAAQAPVIGEFIMKAFGRSILISQIKNNFYKPGNYDSVEINFNKQLPYKGFKTALLSTLRNFISQDFSKSYEAVGKLDKPVMLLWGKKDAVIPFEYSEKVMQAIPSAEFHSFEEAGHVLMLDSVQDKVDKMILDFFKRR